MNPIQLYADEDFPLPVVEALRQKGYDILTVYQSGKANQAIPDQDVLAFAKSQGRALITLNRRHFIRLHTVSVDHAGIIVCSADTNFEALAQRIDTAIQAQPQLTGQLLRVNLG